MYNFLAHLYKAKRLIYEMVKQDIKQRFVGNVLGALWAFLNPLITLLIFWFVFEVGFKVPPVEQVPFVMWLMAGMIPWFFFSEALSFGTHSIIEKPYLVKKVVFRVSILPIIKIGSALIIHLFFIIILYLVFIFWNYPSFSLTLLQIPYYIFCSCILLLGASWLTSATVVFFKDIAYLVGIIIQFGFWLTPVFWSYKMMPDHLTVYLKLNPVMYITEGFRDSLIYQTWFWERPLYTCYFWVFAMMLLFFGAFTFKKLRPHFADVL